MEELLDSLSFTYTPPLPVASAHHLTFTILIVDGLPQDLSERELRALFRFAPGFVESSKVDLGDPLAEYLLHGRVVSHQKSFTATMTPGAEIEKRHSVDSHTESSSSTSLSSSLSIPRAAFLYDPIFGSLTKDLSNRLTAPSPTAASGKTVEEPSSPSHHTIHRRKSSIASSLNFAVKRNIDMGTDAPDTRPVIANSASSPFLAYATFENEQQAAFAIAHLNGKPYYDDQGWHSDLDHHHPRPHHPLRMGGFSTRRVMQVIKAASAPSLLSTDDESQSEELEGCGGEESIVDDLADTLFRGLSTSTSHESLEIELDDEVRVVNLPTQRKGSIKLQSLLHKVSNQVKRRSSASYDIDMAEFVMDDHVHQQRLFRAHAAATAHPGASSSASSSAAFGGRLILSKPLLVSAPPTRPGSTVCNGSSTNEDQQQQQHQQSMIKPSISSPGSGVTNNIPLPTNTHQTMVIPTSSNNQTPGMLWCENPPCNTLYVGNLPPSTQPLELYALFSPLIGFKRMSFREKIGTGPMCFVEFESIDLATKAMMELYGTMLEGSTKAKGGIRLSYSKNPLGVRKQGTVSLSSNVPTPAIATSASTRYYAQAAHNVESEETDASDEEQLHDVYSGNHMRVTADTYDLKKLSFII